MARKHSQAKLEKIRASKRKYRDENKEKVQEINTKWRKNKKESKTPPQTRSVDQNKTNKKGSTLRTAKFRVKQKAKVEAEKSKLETKRKKDCARQRKHRTKPPVELSFPTTPEHTVSTPQSKGYSKSPRSKKSRQRSVRALKRHLPTTPGKRADCIEKLAFSPSVKTILRKRCVLQNAETTREVKVARALLTDINSSRESMLKDKSSLAKNVATNALSMAFGPTVRKAKLQGAVGKKLNISRKAVYRCVKRNREILKGPTGTWKHTTRKIRSDALSAEVKEKVLNFWSTAASSRYTGNKNDVKRVRLGPKQYAEHATMILEKRQSDVYNDFCIANPDCKMHQRTFEKLKPFWVIAARSKDRNSCCCRYCVEFKMCKDSAMKFRKKLNAKHGYDAKIYETVSELVADTMCNPPTLKCIERKCSACGVQKYEFLAEEQCDSQVQGTVKWNKYEYKTITTSKGREKKKLILVEKETSPAEMSQQLLQCMKSFSKHEFTAKNQHAQFKTLMEGLPLGEAVTVNDYSQNYSCRYQNEIQTLFFEPEQAEIHVTIIYRHSLAIDGVESTEESPNIITEQLFTIFPGNVPVNSNSVHVVREHIAEHFKNIEYNLTTMHEFNDQCAAQYKSRHTLYDLSCTEEDFGFTVIRNYHETSHAKGPQDAAGGCIKRFADLAVVRGEVIIQDAQKFCTFLNEKFTQPRKSNKKSNEKSKKKSSTLKQRIFIYQDKVDFSRAAKKIKNFKIRQIHCVKSTGVPGKLLVRNYSCYCGYCMDGMYELCDEEVGGSWKEILIQEDNSPIPENTEEDDTDENICDQVTEGSIIAVADGDGYKLIHISEDLQTLDSIETDGRGLTLPAGANVFKGSCCESENTIKSGTYFKVSNITEFISPEDIRYVCTSVKDKVLSKRGALKLIKKSELDDIVGVFM